MPDNMEVNEQKNPGKFTAPAKPLADNGSATGRGPSVPQVQSRKMQYMFGPRDHAGLVTLAAGPQPLYDANQVHEALTKMPDVDVVRRVKPSGLTTLSAGPNVSRDIIVVTTTPEQGSYLQSVAHAGMIVERDHLLKHFAGAPQFATQPTSSQTLSASADVKFHVQDA